MWAVQLASTIRGVRYRFASVKEVLAKANPPKSGDDLAGISARDAVERVAARAVLADLTLRRAAREPGRAVRAATSSRAWSRTTLDEQAFRAVAHLTVGQFREWLLEIETTGPTLRAVAPGPHARDGGRGVQADVELRPDDGRREVPGRRAREQHARPARAAVVALPAEPPDRRRRRASSASTREGLSYGCGDAVIGVNPATDTAESTAEILTRDRRRCCERNEVPTQHCVLSHVTVQMKALELGCPMDLMFQSLAGHRGRQHGLRHLRRADRRGLGDDEGEGLDARARTACTSRPARARRCRRRRTTAPTR